MLRRGFDPYGWERHTPDRLLANVGDKQAFTLTLAPRVIFQVASQNHVFGLQEESGQTWGEHGKSSWKSPKVAG